ncbi:hypothetical protein [Pedobacter alluvionis]|uniref:Uncharacterized protein n=1 Tax=Pedobacter alluvionis TaxID=475253 RepID=A0A497YGP6_9SPHI|nr:hypothetical protein [Pedobacter alluvionis]RLJ79530.1 hypothetical protein BCL90_0233 [Pedobacter alluvionis]TFB30877.1 hypothetical protein E3V97_09590 [Pedobacter alluvionis]
MKTALKIMVLSLLMINAKAQSVKQLSVELLSTTRADFNKKLMKLDSVNLSDLPPSVYLFSRDGKHEVNIGGVTVLTDQKVITGIKDMNLSEESLKNISDRLKVLDKLQKAYSEASNDEYRSNKRNKNNIVFYDRRFFVVLNAMKATLKDFKKMYSASQDDKTKTMSVAAIRNPNVDWKFYSHLIEVEQEKITALTK